VVILTLLFVIEETQTGLTLAGTCQRRLGRTPCSMHSPLLTSCNTSCPGMLHQHTQQHTCRFPQLVLFRAGKPPAMTSCLTTTGCRWVMTLC